MKNCIALAVLLSATVVLFLSVVPGIGREIYTPDVDAVLQGRTE
jgi:hypothetical protein